MSSSSTSSASLTLIDHPDLSVSLQTSGPASARCFPRLARHNDREIVWASSATSNGHAGVFVAAAPAPGEQPAGFCVTDCWLNGISSCGTVTSHEINAAGTRMYFLTKDDERPAVQYELLSYDVAAAVEDPVRQAAQDAKSKGVRIMNLAEPTARVVIQPSSGFKPNGVSLSPDGTLLAVAGDDKMHVCLYDEATLQLRRVVRLEDAVLLSSPQSSQSAAPFSAASPPIGPPNNFMSGYVEWAPNSRMLCARVKIHPRGGAPNSAWAAVVLVDVDAALHGEDMDTAGAAAPAGAASSDVLVADRCVVGVIHTHPSETSVAFSSNSSRILVVHPRDRSRFQLVDCATGRVVLCGSVAWDRDVALPRFFVDDDHCLFASANGDHVALVRLGDHCSKHVAQQRDDEDEYEPAPVVGVFPQTLCALRVFSGATASSNSQMFDRALRVIWFPTASAFKAMQVVPLQ